MEDLKNILRVFLKEYWGEVTGGVVRDQGTKEAQRTAPGVDEDDPFMLNRPGKFTQKLARQKIKKYFKDMKMEPTDKPGKTYK